MRRDIDIPNHVHVDLEKPVSCEVTGHKIPQGITGIATFEMKVESEYLFVGDGRQDYCDQYQEAYYTFFRSKGQLTVPGTSLKGAVRSVAEAISASCVSVRSNLDKEIIKLRGYSDCKEEKDGKIELCPACRVFGAMGYRGHVSFSDALPNGDTDVRIVKIAELWEPKKLKNLKKSGKLKYTTPRRKFYKSGRYTELKNQKPEKSHRYIEVVPMDSVFTFNLIFENAQESDLSLVFHSMGIGQNFKTKIGGAKPRCLGNVSFAAKKIVEINHLTDIEEKDPENFISNAMRNRDLIRPERLEELAKKISSEAACIGGLGQWN